MPESVDAHPSPTCVIVHEIGRPSEHLEDGSFPLFASSATLSICILSSPHADSVSPRVGVNNLDREDAITTLLDVCLLKAVQWNYMQLPRRFLLQVEARLHLYSQSAAVSKVSKTPGCAVWKGASCWPRRSLNAPQTSARRVRGETRTSTFISIMSRWYATFRHGGRLVRACEMHRWYWIWQLIPKIVAFSGFLWADTTVDWFRSRSWRSSSL